MKNIKIYKLVRQMKKCFVIFFISVLFVMGVGGIASAAAGAEPNTESFSIEAEPGVRVQLSADPDPGYVFDHWTVEKGNITITDNCFIMPAEDVVVKAVFRLSMVQKGDVNEDGLVDHTDVNILSLWFEGFPIAQKYTETEAADIDDNGVFERKDVMILSRYVAGWEIYNEYFNQ